MLGGDLDVGHPGHALRDRALEERAAHDVRLQRAVELLLVDPEVMPADVSPHVDGNARGVDGGPEIREEPLEDVQPAQQKDVPMAPLRDPLAWLVLVRELVALDEGHAREVVRQYARGQQARDAPPEDDRVRPIRHDRVINRPPPRPVKEPPCARSLNP